MNVEHAQISMNIFDAIIIGVLALSSIVAFFRGFVREVLSLGAWVGAGVITMYLFPQSTQFMKAHVKSEHLAAGSAALGTYFCALITLSLINSIIIRYVKSGSEVGVIDNALGLLFGILRGTFIVSLAYLIMSAVVPKENPPVWLKTSVTKPYLQEGAVILAKIAPRYLSNLEDIVRKQREGSQNTKGDPTDDNGIGEKDIPLTSEEIDKKAKEGSSDAGASMHRLINSIKTPTQEGSTDDKR